MHRVGRMKTNSSLLSLLIFSLVLYGACKKGPTGPDTDLISELSGTIILGGDPFPGVDVYLSWNATGKVITGSDGKFSFTDLLSGDYIITPSKLGYAFSPSNYEVGSQNRNDLNFTAQTALTGAEIDEIASNFTAKNQNNQDVSLYDFHGKVILMDFTADWCSACREKAEKAEQFYQKYKDSGLIYILIVIDGDPQIWADTYGLTFPVLDDNSQAIYNIYKRTSIPLPHVLDRNCTIRYKQEGWNESTVENIINKYL